MHTRVFLSNIHISETMHTYEDTNRTSFVWCERKVTEKERKRKKRNSGRVTRKRKRRRKRKKEHTEKKKEI